MHLHIDEILMVCIPRSLLDLVHHSSKSLLPLSLKEITVLASLRCRVRPQSRAGWDKKRYSGSLSVD
ncbi:hypothetical protein M378DRAFT_167448 [Amanita muscaria Koide BX008]|uniref:Uncharacterized protein n=1 Tax=Amanita muscaria (strain Koide BX008) TaxID=946122 RepID=A0A0C2WXH8_AMAMK|nr:hypothetical protein M378DRAFT_167448 [Amanita muscaria Koide BX008]